MFSQRHGVAPGPNGNAGVEEVRLELEGKLSADDGDYESWEQLGHVWRHYGHVQRTIDCYRKALQVCCTPHPSNTRSPSRAPSRSPSRSASRSSLALVLTHIFRIRPHSHSFLRPHPRPHLLLHFHPCPRCYRR